jgi:hypothetical protein
MYKQAALDGTPGTFVVAEVIQEGGNLEVESGAIQVTGNFTQESGNTTMYAGTTLSIDGTLQQYGGTVTLANGTISAADGYNIELDASFDGWGAILADVFNAGTMHVDGIDGIGVLSITGDYTQSATGLLAMEIDGDEPSAGSSDRVDVSGTATLGGMLHADWSDGLGDDADDEVLTLMIWGSRSGEFDLVELPSNLGWDDGWLQPFYDAPGYEGSLVAWFVSDNPDD